MKRALLVLLVLFSFKSFSETVTEAFEDFYNDQSIDSNHCGRNIQFFLRYLESSSIDFQNAYVVSVHEPSAFLNHFDARWGKKDKYKNGKPYFHDNWYFHVFAVIDGIAYDFSQRGMKAMPLKKYLRKSYLPESKTRNIYFQGVLTQEKLLRSYLNLEINIYSAKNYKKNLGPVMYQGVFIELFNL